MKIYTKTGDSGETGLFAGPRVSKDDPRIEAYGAVDELNALLGAVRSEDPPRSIDDVLAHIQHELFSVGAELCTPDPDQHGLRVIGASHIQALEAAIDRHEATLPPLKQFILPGGTKAAALLHVARSVCRRAERRLITLAVREPEHSFSGLIIYLNRLSDLLFVLARAANAASGRADIPWQKP